MKKLTFPQWYKKNVSRNHLQIAADFTSAQGLVICPVPTCRGRDIGENCRAATGEGTTHDARRVAMFREIWRAGNETAYFERPFDKEERRPRRI